MRRFTKDFKETAVVYCNKHGVEKTAKKFKIATSTVYVWVRSFRPTKNLRVKVTKKVTRR